MQELTIANNEQNYGLYADAKGRIVATSLAVAERFGKMHKNVLQDIANLDCSPEFSRLNFQPSEYTNERGKTYPMYEMTRQGFTFLVMGYTGKDAARYKEGYIAAFDELERRQAAPAPAVDLRNPDAMLQYLSHYASETKRLAEEVQAAQPAVAYFGAAKATDEDVNLRTFAKSVSAKPQKTIDVMKQKFLYYENKKLVPYQEYVNRGWFVVRYATLVKDNGDEIETAQTFVTSLGRRKLHEWLQKSVPELLAKP